MSSSSAGSGAIRVVTRPAAAIRRRKLRRALTIVLVAVAVLSVLLLSAINYWQARSQLLTSVENGLVDQQATRADTVADGLNRIESQVAVIADDPGVVEALTEFSAAYDQLQSSSNLLTDAERANLESYYLDNVIARIRAAGLEPPDAADLLPGTEAGRYLQYHYVVRNPFQAGDRDQLTVSDTDTSSYADVHAKWHPALTRYTNAAIGSLLLLDTQGTILYSTNKAIDLGTNTRTGPYRDSALATAVNQRLPGAPVGEAILVDFERYLPAAARPTLFGAAVVQADSEIVGAVVVEILVDALDEITTSGGQWEATGLGETGETYVVGADGLMRSDSRLWLEDPEAYIRRLDATGGDGQTGELMRLFDSTVLLQSVDTPAVATAFDGETFVGRSQDYLGRSTLAVASPVAAQEVNWVLVAAIGWDEATQPLGEYTRRMLIAAAIIVLVVAILGGLLAVRMTRPIQPVVDAAGRVAAGDLEAEFPDLGRNEFGDLARRLNILTSDLREQEAALAREEAATTKLLLSAMPPRLVSKLQSEERGLADLIDSATIVAFGVAGLVDQPDIDQDSALELSVALSQEFEQIAEDVGLERVWSSSMQHIFASGLTKPVPEAHLAARFALLVAAAVERFGQEHGVALSYSAGLCAGEVVATLVEADQLTYGVFGEAARTALALESIAGPGQILLCDATAELLEGEWGLRIVEDLIDLRGEPLAARELLSGPDAGE